jgi:hypothetical protein
MSQPTNGSRPPQPIPMHPVEFHEVPINQGERSRFMYGGHWYSRVSDVPTDTIPGRAVVVDDPAIFTPGCRVLVQKPIRPNITLMQTIMLHLRASGPCTFRSIFGYSEEQYVKQPDELNYTIVNLTAIALTQLCQNGYVAASDPDAFEPTDAGYAVADVLKHNFSVRPEPVPQP